MNIKIMVVVTAGFIGGSVDAAQRAPFGAQARTSRQPTSIYLHDQDVQDARYKDQQKYDQELVHKDRLNCAELQRLCAEENVQFHREKNNALCVAAAHGYREAVIYLLEQGAQVNCDVRDPRVPANSPLITSICMGAFASCDIVQCFVPLVSAVRWGNIAVVECLLQCGADINQRESMFQQHSALRAAVGNRDIPMVKLLISHGADLSDYAEIDLLEEPNYGNTLANCDARSWQLIAEERKTIQSINAIITLIKAHV